MRKPKCPAHGKRSMPAGNSVSMMRSLASLPCTKMGLVAAGLGVGISTSIACCKLPSVADKPQVISAGCHLRNRAKANCSCTPRLLPINSCHSSTTTICKLANVAAASGRVSNRVKLSGVVMSAVGKRLDWRVRSALLVSPVRSPTLQSRFNSVIGAIKARSVSAASARIGVIHNTVNGCMMSFCLAILAAFSITTFSLAATGFLAKRSMAAIHIA